MFGDEHFPSSKLEAKTCGEAVLRLYDALDEPARQLLPADVRDFLSAEGPLRRHLCSWLRGDILRAQLPVEVMKVIASFAFIPVAERCVEAQHSIMKKRLGFNRAGPLACSLALRSGTLIAPTLLRQPEMLKELAAVFAETRHIRKYATSRGLMSRRRLCT